MSEPPKPRTFAERNAARRQSLEAHWAEMAAIRARAPTPPSTLASKLPPAARAVVDPGAPLTIDGVKVRRPLILAADVPKLKRPPPDSKVWRPAMRMHAATRKKGDVQRPTLERTAELIHGLCSAAAGCVQLTFEQIAGKLGVCRETVRKAVNWWHDTSDLLDVKNVQGYHPIKVKGEVRTLLVNEANLYLPRLPDELDKQPEGEVLAPVLRKLRRHKAQIQRWAKLSGLSLVARSLGLNTTPVKVDPRRLNPEGRPAPA